MNKRVIRQNVDGVEKILIVEIIDEVNVDDIDKQINNLTEEIHKIDNQINVLQQQRQNYINEIAELQFILKETSNAIKIEDKETKQYEQHNEVIETIPQVQTQEEVVYEQAEQIQENKQENFIREEREMVFRTSKPLFKGRFSKPF